MRTLQIGHMEYSHIYWTNPRECKKNSLIYKFVMPNCQSLILIGLQNEHFIVLTNQKLCQKGVSAQGVNFQETAQEKYI